MYKKKKKTQIKLVTGFKWLLWLVLQATQPEPSHISVQMIACVFGWVCASCTSFSWYWLRAQTAPRCQLERPRSGRLSMIKFTSAKPFCCGGAFRMVDGALGIQEHQSYCTQRRRMCACDTFTPALYLSVLSTKFCSNYFHVSTVDLHSRKRT